jgi:hypothetical protein
MHINAHGSILSDSLNTVFSARINRKTGNAVFDVTGKQCDMSRRNLELVTGDIVPSSGMIDFHLFLEKTIKSIIVPVNLLSAAVHLR